MDDVSLHTGAGCLSREEKIDFNFVYAVISLCGLILLIKMRVISLIDCRTAAQFNLSGVSSFFCGIVFFNKIKRKLK